MPPLRQKQGTAPLYGVGSAPRLDPEEDTNDESGDSTDNESVRSIESGAEADPEQAPLIQSRGGRQSSVKGLAQRTKPSLGLLQKKLEFVQPGSVATDGGGGGDTAAAAVSLSAKGAHSKVGDAFLVPRGSLGCVLWPWRFLGRAGLTQPHMVMLEMYAAALAVFLVGRLVGGDLALYHFTYWGLLLSFGLAVAWIAVGVRDSVKDPSAGPWEGKVLATAGPFVMGVLLLVAVLITAVPVMDPNIVKSQGGDTPLGIVNLFNLLMHYLPPVVFGTALVARWYLVKQYLSGLHRAQGRVPTRAILQEAFILVLALLLPCTTANMYTSLFDFNAAYGVDIVHSRAYFVGYVTAGLYYLVMRAFFLGAFNHRPAA